MNAKMLRDIVNKKEGNRDFVRNLARVLGKTAASISNKNTGTTSWTVDEIKTIRDRYRLTGDQILKIFFD